MDFIPWLRKSYTESVVLRNYLSSVFISPVTSDHTWPIHTNAVLKKAHQCLFFLRQLRKFSVSPKTLKSFYTCTLESILTGTAPPSTAKLCREWYKLHRTLLEVSFPPSRISTPGGV